MDNTLDVLLTSQPSSVIKIRPAAPLSDHDTVIADLDLCLRKKPTSQRLIYNWKKADTVSLCNEVSRKLSEFKILENDVDRNWNGLKNILIVARDNHVPHRMTTSRHNLPWYHQNLRRLGNKKQRLYNKAKRSGSRSDFNEFKKCRSEFKKCLKNAQQEYYLDFLEPKLDTNSKFLFSHIKHMKNDSVGIEAISHKGSITTDPKTIAEAFADQY